MLLKSKFIIRTSAAHIISISDGLSDCVCVGYTISTDDHPNRWVEEAHVWPSKCDPLALVSNVCAMVHYYSFPSFSPFSIQCSPRTHFKACGRDPRSFRMNLPEFYSSPLIQTMKSCFSPQPFFLSS